MFAFSLIVRKFSRTAIEIRNLIARQGSVGLENIVKVWLSRVVTMMVLGQTYKTISRILDCANVIFRIDLPDSFNPVALAGWLLQMCLVGAFLGLRAEHLRNTSTYNQHSRRAPKRQI